MDAEVRGYIDAIAPEHRPLFDRLHNLVLKAHPEAAVVLSYGAPGIPTYKVGKRRFYIGVWKHWVALYGWEQGAAAGSIARHPETKQSKGTIHLKPAPAVAIPDQELLELVRAALG